MLNNALYHILKMISQWNAYFYAQNKTMHLVEH